MSKAKFEAARQLIQDKHYSEARALLKTIDHPTARQWERKLDILDPPEIKIIDRRLVFGVAGLSVILLIGIVSGVLLSNRDSTSQTVAMQPGSTATDVSATVTSTSVGPTVTSTPIPPSITPTLAFTSTATLTSSPTNTATITNTPLPTRTRVPTNTPEPPQIARLGPLYDRLYDETYNVEMELKSVRFTISGDFQKASAGNIYVIAEIVVRNLGPGTLRYISDFSFQAKDGNGALRSAALFVFSECSFDMVDLTAGGSVSGCVAFEVPNSSGSVEIIYAPFQYEGLEPGRYISFTVRG